LSVEIEQSCTRAGDLIQLVGLSHKSFIFTLVDGGEFHTHRGVIKHDDLIGKPWGIQIFSHNGSPFFLLQPSLPDILKSTKRATQIMYPKEIGYILIQLGVRPGIRIIEAGTGSGSFTTALSYAIGDRGRIYSYEAKEANQKIAIRSLDKLGLTGNIEFKVRDIREGFDETGVDAVFLDVANPYDYLKQVKTALKPGGYFASNDFAFIDVCDISQRYYKTEPSRFRPTDRMIAHTGYLIFARSVTIDHELADPKLLKEIGVLGIEDEKAAEIDEINETYETTEE